MHRWFFADEELVCKEPSPPSPSSSETSRTPSTTSLPESEWTFKVNFDWNLCSNETLAICGSIPILGNWDVQHSLPLIKDNENSSCWTLTLVLPRKYNIYYRYLVYAFNAKGRKIIRFWETHCECRVIDSDQVQDNEYIEYETFGLWNNQRKIERGWLNPYVTGLQFKIFQAPFILKTKIKPLLYVKITPLKLKSQEKCVKENDGKNSLEESDEDLRQTFAYCEVASLQDQNGEFRKQTKYGLACGSDDLLLFNLTLGDVNHTAYQLDLYNYSPKAGSDVPPKHFGYQYILPQELKGSEGTLQLIIMCGTKHRPIGTMKCDYLVIAPMHTQDLNLEKTFQRYWNSKNVGMFIGHRGCGKSFWFQNNILRENTIDSFDLAYEHGAKMVEFDIQMTQDMVPIVYHDFLLYISNNLDVDPKEYDIMHLPLTANEIKLLKPLEGPNNTDLIHLPVNQFTLEQLSRVKVYEPQKAEDVYSNCGSKIKNNKPFITLEKILKDLDIKIGFVIEIKWPQKLTDGNMQDSFVQNIDKNDFVDKILEIVLQKAGSRRIYFSSFDADICTMVRLKQNIYPVLFLIRDNENEQQFLDPRGTSIYSIYFAYAMELLGILVHCADIKKTPGIVSDIQERDLCVFSWGKESRTEDSRKFLKALGVDGVFCDRINHALEPMDLKQNIFIIDLLEKAVKNNKLCNF